MKALSLPRTPVGICYVAALAAAALSAVGTGAALWAKARMRPAVLLVTGNDDPKVVTPGVIPDSLARDYARDFVANLENYVPATLERNLAFLQGRIAPEGYHDFQRFSTGLKKLVKESKQASQLALEDPAQAVTARDGGRIGVTLRGVRRIYVESALLQEARLTYLLALVPGQPTRENPMGLLVAGFSVKASEPGDPNDKRP